MINSLVSKVFGTQNERDVKRLLPNMQAITALEPEMQKLSDEQLRAKTADFRKLVAERLGKLPEEPDAGSDR